MNVKKGIKETGDNVVSLLVYALILGSIVTASAFTSLTILNVTTLTTALVSSRYPSKWAANINIIDAVRTR